MDVNPKTHPCKTRKMGHPRWTDCIWIARRCVSQSLLFASTRPLWMATGEFLNRMADLAVP